MDTRVCVGGWRVRGEGCERVYLKQQNLRMIIYAIYDHP